MAISLWAAKKEKGVRLHEKCTPGDLVTNGKGGHPCFISPSLKNTTPSGQLSLEGKEKATVFLCFD